MNNSSKDVISTVSLYLIIILSMFVSFGISANSMTEKTKPGLLLAQADSCAGKCEAAKKRCMSQNLKTNIHGVKMVTPDGAKRCWAAYHRCNSSCK